MPMLRLATTSSVSLLAIAIANSPFIVNAGDAGLELFQCKASGTITMTDAPGFQPVSEEINVELMVEVDELNGNARINRPFSEDMDPWGAAIFDGEAVQFNQQILHTQTEVTILRKSGKFYYGRKQSRVFPKFLTTGEGVCRVVD
tara:strand:- start:162 stop:596 length:435 start_codon:yes stop_codon:yes gene_type:complete